MKRSKRWLKPCPRCRKSGKKLWIAQIFDGTFMTRFFGKYYIECPSCHWCGETKYFLWRAKRAWNRRSDNEPTETLEDIQAREERIGI